MTTRSKLPPGALSHAVLAQVQANPGITPARIAQRVARTIPSVYSALRGLVRRGVVRRDGRGYWVTTPLRRPVRRRRGLFPMAAPVVRQVGAEVFEVVPLPRSSPYLASTIGAAAFRARID